MVNVRIIADVYQREGEGQPLVTVGVGDLYVGEVPANGQSKDDDLEGGDEELEEQEARVSVDADNVFPGEGGNVDRTREEGTGPSITLAGGDQRGSNGGG